MHLQYILLFIRLSPLHRKHSAFQNCGTGFGLGPDSMGSLDWTRIQMRIRNPDPDPGGQKWPTNIGKS